MNTRQYRPELLAPVGSWEALVAAVENGADAVYLGGKNFSARQYASNFDEEELKKAFGFAHLRGVKVFVAVNTLMSDEELPAALDYLKFLYEAGADAVILQDLGLARLARKALPDLELHASTQMTVHNLAGVEYLRELGFARIVLAREVTLDQMKYIKDKSPAELEVFVHGALCISYSGQCLMSSLIGGRSGNRGRCAQPCRLTYSLVDHKGRVVSDQEIGEHLLSPRDLNTLEILPMLLDARIDSFKIEGRMKRPEYVATVVATYRKAIDNYLAHGRVELEDQDRRDIKQVFNRDFTTGYFLGNQGSSLMSFKKPNNRGTKLGRVTQYDPQKKMAYIQLEDRLTLGDGLEIWVKKGGRQGITADKIILKGKEVTSALKGEVVGIHVPRPLPEGDRVFKTFDSQLMEKARETFDRLQFGTKETLWAEVWAKVDEPLKLVFIDAKGNRGEAQSESLGQQALKRPSTSEYLRDQLDRLGNTPFVLGELEAHISGEVMLPASVINEVRREALANLEKVRLQGYTRTPVEPYKWHQIREGMLKLPTKESSKKGRQPLLTVVVGETSLVERAIRSGAQRVIISLDNYRHQQPVSKEGIQKALTLAMKEQVELLLQSPRILQEEEFRAFVKFLEELKTFPIGGIVVGNFGLIKTLKDQGFKWPIFGDFSLNIFNSHSVAHFIEAGLSGLTLSPELTMDQLRVISKLPWSLEVLVHGDILMMISEYCAPGSIAGGRDHKIACNKPCKVSTFGLQDRMNFVFPLALDKYCHMHLFNPKELCIVEDVPKLIDMGINSLRLELKLATGDKLKKVIEIYRGEIQRYLINGKKYTSPELAKEELVALSAKGVTKGHFYRGVL